MTIQIREVNLYVGLTEDAADCYAAKKLLASEGIPCQLMMYTDESHIKETLEALSSWTWGPNHDEKQTFTRLPVLTWRTFYSDFREPTIHAAAGVSAIRKCDLISQKQFVAK